ncbi:hypothetical protein Lal_00019871 [Lupinus albus]|uniref:Uncharacterized protein n=1 Tax=Lupinus albus TaxID=3870 RepID=A0A6A5PT10_LUPAL|nr:hypothetical protein Lalb_Chr01g0000491 [Lupinus albus]KAF1899740.1 hypothetical protein Lal_00019871 [Lupinus albus]
MVLLLHKSSKLYSKLDNHIHNHHDHHHHHHHQSMELSSSLQVFQLQVSKFIGQLALDLESEYEVLSLSWIQKCFDLLPFTDKAFAKLVLDIDYPMRSWEVDSIERYLNYTLCLLELFNSISYSLSHLGQTRLSLSHGLSLLENENSSSLASATRHLKPIQLACFSFSTNFGKDLHIQGDNNNNKARFLSSKEMVINEALKEMEHIGFCVCGVVLSGLCNNGKPYLELRKMAGGFDGSLVLMLDTKINEQLLKKVPILKEVKEINDVVADLVVASDEVKNDVAKELKTKLQVFEKLSDVVKMKVDDMFAKVMSQRTELIDCIRVIKQPLKSVASLLV